MEGLMGLLDSMNVNDRNISLTWNVSTECIHFLDLEIFNTNEGIITKSFFKTTDRNSYIPVTSCHFKPWLSNIPRGQYTRMRRNCTRAVDYETQSERLSTMFLEKGYQKEFLEKEKNKVGCVNREDLLKDSTKVTDNENHEGISVVLDYSTQSYEVRRIICKYWSVLKQDAQLKDVLPDKPKFVFKRAPNLRDRLIHNVVDPPPPKPKMFLDLEGFYSCGRCYSCSRIPDNARRLKEFSNPRNGLSYKIRDFISCDTVGVVYALKCPCNLVYVGRTTRALKKRMEEHGRHIRNGSEKHNLYVHFKRIHNQSTAGIKFWGIEAPKRHWRGSNFIREISKRESWWIHQLGSLVPGGLNREFDLKCFLSNH